MSQVVVDCSVTMCWGLPDETNDYAEGALKAVFEFGGIVPQLWLWEVSNAIVVSERRRRITLLQGQQFFETLRRVPLGLDADASLDRLGETLSLARNFQLTAYDAAYLELARHKSLQLCTIDRKLILAAPAAGVQLFEMPASSS